MSTNNAKYLVLRGKNKDIYFIQKRLTKSQSLIIGKDFIKKSLETKSLEEAIAKRDKIISELDQMELNINVPENINMNDNIQNKNIKYTADTIENSNKDEKSENMENNMTISDIDMSTNEDISNNSISENQKNGLVSLKMLKFPNKEDLVAKIDKLIPIAILFITLFIALVA
tara:strand:- start:6539 stop:7054 length:516 start_codon:yes stop_codon:yes gene_type:complete